MYEKFYCERPNIMCDSDCQSCNYGSAIQYVEFTSEEFNMIIEYMKLVDAVTVQAAIMNAVSVAMDNADA